MSADPRILHVEHELRSADPWAALGRARDRAAQRPADAPETDPLGPRSSVVQLWMATLEAAALVEGDDAVQASSAADRALLAARRQGDPELLGVAARVAGVVRTALGDLGGARANFAESAELLAKTRDPLRRADLAADRARLAFEEADPAAGEAHAAEAVQAYDAAGERRAAAVVLLLGARFRRSLGDREGGREVLAGVLRRVDPEDPVLVMLIEGGLADQALVEGSPAEALRLARRALGRAGQALPRRRADLWEIAARAHREQGGSDDAHAALGRAVEALEGAGWPSDGPRALAVHLMLQDDQFADARAAAERWLARLGQHPDPGRAAPVHALLLPSTVDARDWTAFAHHLRRATALGQSTGRLHLLAAEAARRAGAMCAAIAEGRAGPLARAVRAHSLALAVHARAGRQDEVAREVRSLQELGARSSAAAGAQGSSAARPADPGRSSAARPGDPGRSSAARPAEPGRSSAARPAEPGRSSAARPAERVGSSAARPADGGPSPASLPPDLRRGPIPAGPFDLLRPIGSGTTGEVWRARHHDRRWPVAIKVLQHDDPRLRQLLADEIRAVATLDHPNVVRVLGTGVLGPEAEAIAPAALRAGSPWFAMELAEGGTLEPLCGTLPWSQCRAVLLALLDALAHAHARGVVHLDLKPANVLLRTLPDGRRGVMLTDFGLAGLFARASGARVAGTPSYMAPEQFRGERRDLGPWTDLYAFGCLAWHLLTGAPPFSGELEALREQHTTAPIPRLEPPMVVPPGLGSWIERLMAKATADRYLRAADAAHGLQRFPEGVASTAPDFDPADAPLSVASVVLSIEGGSLHDPRFPSLVRLDGARGHDAPPAPEDWRPPSVPRLDVDLAEAALSLFSLRRPPLVGREAERDRLWAVLREVVELGAPRVARIDGPPGSGKTALARWLCERAHELGVATILDGSPGIDGQHGLRAMVVRHLRLEGLDAEAAAARIGAMVPTLPLDVREDLAAIAAERGVGLPVAEQVGAVAALIGATASARPVVVWLAHPSSAEESVLVQVLGGSAGPVLVLCEVDPALAEVSPAGGPPRREPVPPVELAPGALQLRLDVEPAGAGPGAGSSATSARLAEGSGGAAGATTPPGEAGPSSKAPTAGPSPASGEGLGRADVGVPGGAGSAVGAPAAEPSPARWSGVPGAGDPTADREAGSLDPQVQTGQVHGPRVDRDPAPGPVESERSPGPAGGARVTLGPMGDRDVAALVDALVPLRSSLRARVVELAGGNPDLAVQLVADRIEADALVPVDGVYELRPGERLVLPQRTTRLYDERITRILGGLAGPERALVCAAALIGPQCTRARWSALCAAAGIAEEEALRRLAGLLQQDASEPAAAGPRFAHPAIPLILKDTWADLAAVELALAALDETAPAAVRGPLLVRAVRLAEAAQPLLEAARDAFAAGDLDRAAECLDRRADVRRTLGADPDDGAVEDEVLRARIAFQAGRPYQAEAERAATLAERHGAQVHLGEARLLLGCAAAERGDPAQAQVELRRALDAFVAADDPIGTARALVAAGDLARSAGEPDRGSEHYRRAAQVLRGSTAPELDAAIRIGAARTALARGRIDEAESDLLSALNAAQVAGARGVESDLLCALGDAARLGGRIPSADARYRAALAAAPWHDVRRTREIALRRAWLRLAAGRSGEAAGQVDALPASDGVGPFEAGRVLATLVLAVRRDDRTWSGTLEAARRALGHLRDADAPWLLELAGRRACDAGRSDRAVVVWRLASAAYRALGRPSDAGRVDRAADTLQRAGAGR